MNRIESGQEIKLGSQLTTFTSGSSGQTACLVKLSAIQIYTHINGEKDYLMKFSICAVHTRRLQRYSCNHV